jgi:hypothetical protein
MKKVEIEVKSNKENLGNVDVEQFESIEEAVAFLAKDANAEKGETGESVALGLINSQYKANVTNAFRVSKTRGVSPMTALREKIKSDPNAKAQLEALLVALNLPSKLD